MNTLKLLTVATLISCMSTAAFCQTNGETASKPEAAETTSQDFSAATPAPEIAAKDLFMKIMSFVVSDPVKNILKNSAACATTYTVDGMKACVKNIKELPQSTLNSIKSGLGDGLNYGCTANWVSDLCKDDTIRAACGVLACNLDLTSKVKNCFSKHSDDCTKYMIQ